MVPATTNDLARAPELALLDAVRDLLDHALALLVVRQTEIARRDGGLVGLPPRSGSPTTSPPLCATFSASCFTIARPPPAAARHHARKPFIQMPLPHHPR